MYSIITNKIYFVRKHVQLILLIVLGIMWLICNKYPPTAQRNKLIKIIEVNLKHLLEINNENGEGKIRKYFFNILFVAHWLFINKRVLIFDINWVELHECVYLSLNVRNIAC